MQWDSVSIERSMSLLLLLLLSLTKDKCAGQHACTMGLFRVVQVVRNYSERLPSACLGPHLARAQHTAATPALLLLLLWVLRQACGEDAPSKSLSVGRTFMLVINAKTQRPS